MRSPIGIMILVLGGWLFATSVVAGAGLRAGIAVRVVTPDPLLPLSGGVGASEPADRKEGELTVRALVVSDGTTTVALVSTDFLGFPAVLGDRVRDQVREIPASNILIGATHTHSAPDPYAFPDAQGKTSADLAYLQSVVDRAAAAIREALGRLEPVSIKVATGEFKGRIAYNAYAEALFDPRGSVVQFVGADGAVRATLVNYAVHPEVLGNRRGICSPDLVGPLYDRLSARGGGTGIFFNGALGGMVTADCRGPDGRDIGTWAEAVRIGEKLADEALRIVAGAPVQAEPELRCRATTVRFPVESPVIRAVLNGSPMGYRTDPDGRVATQVNWIRLGTAQMLTVPGEALPNLGAYLKRKMGGENPMLLGLTNDAFGYILTREDWGAFRRYDYISRTCLGERTAEIYTDAALALAAGKEGEPIREAR
ncbi:MAG: hypothetical protein AB7O66_01080 [Limisphaerales bacterium]